MLHLIGTAHDAPRLERLAEELRKAGFLCSIDVGTPLPAPIASLKQANEIATPPTTATHLLCWTQESLGGKGAELQARIQLLCGDGNCLSLLLDDVAAPESAVTTRTFRIVLQDPEQDAQALAPLVEYLRTQIETPSTQAPTAALADLQSKSNQTLKTGKEIIAKIANMRAWLKAGTLGLFLAILTGAYGFFADVVGTQDKLCSIPLIRENCANRGWGNVPTAAETREWERAMPGRNCALFQSIYARGGHFASEAKRRIDSAKYSPGRDEDRFPLMVPSTEPPVKTETLARSEVVSRAGVLAAEMCRLHAKNFVGEAASGRFEPSGDAQCESRSGGHACTIDGVAICAFIKQNMVETCAPPEIQIPVH